MVRWSAFVAAMGLACTAWADPTILGGEVNITGATLFSDFFRAGASTLDYNDVDGDGCSAQSVPLCPDQLAPLWGVPPDVYWWVVQYRGVGSGNGLAELVAYACNGDIPLVVPSEGGWINTVAFGQPSYNCDRNGWHDFGACCQGTSCTMLTADDCAASAGTYLGDNTSCADANPCNPATAIGACFHLVGGVSVCTRETPANCAALNGSYMGDGALCDSCCASGTPFCPSSIDLATMDVPTQWFVVTGSATNADPDRQPGDDGYGRNPTLSYAGQSNTLKSLGCLNTNVSNPDAHTVYDNPIAWVSIAIIANRGTGYQNVCSSWLHTLFLTGRMPNGENLVACTRDAGSGTRNGAMNSLCLDPSWGMGDNLDLKTDIDIYTRLLGPATACTNLGASGRMEEAVQNRRLGIGYTGLEGASRAAIDAAAGSYELLNVRFDDRGGTAFVRPNRTAVIYNGVPDQDTGLDGWEIGGPETFVTVGDPSGAGYPMANPSAPDYVNNITDSIAAFVDAQSPPATPGEFLATNWTLQAAVGYAPQASPAWDPCHFVRNPRLNPTLQSWTIQHMTLLEPSFGFSNGRVPVRTTNPVWSTLPTPCDCAYPADGVYSDGSHDAYLNRQGGPTPTGALNDRNRIAGDFSGNSVRDISDVPGMMLALYNVNTYVSQDQAAGHSNANNPIVPEIIGDFNGDGNFDCRDVRYFADGLGLVDRTCCPEYPWCECAYNTGATIKVLDRKAGFIAVDQAWQALSGDNNYFNTTWANGRPYAVGDARFDVAGHRPAPGGPPLGYDCVIDVEDYCYVWENLRADVPDLSCDVNGDLAVNAADLAELRTPVGVTLGDLNCDGVLNNFDITPFVKALTDPAAYAAQYPNCCIGLADVNEDGLVNNFDITPFVHALTH